MKIYTLDTQASRVSNFFIRLSFDTMHPENHTCFFR